MDKEKILKKIESIPIMQIPKLYGTFCGCEEYGIECNCPIGEINEILKNRINAISGIDESLITSK